MKRKLLLAALCLAPLIKLTFPVYAFNPFRAQQVNCYLNSNQGPILVSQGTTCIAGGAGCSPNDCPGNTSPIE
jgi:hypothetical protein